MTTSHFPLQLGHSPVSSKVKSRRSQPVGTSSSQRVPLHSSLKGPRVVFSPEQSTLENNLYLYKAIELYRAKKFPESLVYFDKILRIKNEIHPHAMDLETYTTCVKASFYKACMMIQGNGIEKNVDEAQRLFALVWDEFKRVPDSDDDKLFYLARMKDEGWGCPTNKAEALELYINSTARPGTDRKAIAFFNLGLMYFLGEGVQKSDQKTRKMYEMASSMGHMSATYNLAVMMRDGVGGPQDNMEALRLYLANARRGDPKSMNSYALMVKQTNPQVCIHWLRKAIEKGNAYAMYNFAFILENGELGQEQDVEGALHYYLKAAQQGHVAAVESYSSLSRKLRDTVMLGNM